MEKQTKVLISCVRGIHCRFKGRDREGVKKFRKFCGRHKWRFPEGGLVGAWASSRPPTPAASMMRLGKDIGVGR